MNKKQEIVLYMRKTCPFCQKVFKALKEYEKSVEMKDISEENNRKELLEIGGKQQVPCIVVNGEPLYESDDIIAWIRKYHEIL